MLADAVVDRVSRLGGGRSGPNRLLYVIDHLATAEAGTERQLFQLIGGLDRRRFEPHIAVLRWSPFLSTRPLPDCPVHDLGLSSLGTVALPIGVARLARLLIKLRVRVAHVLFNDASLVAPAVCRLVGTRVVVSRRDMGFWYTPRLLQGLRISDRFVDVIVANCEAVRQNVHAREHVPLSRIRVIVNGYDAERFQAPGAPDLRRRLGIAATDRIVGVVANLTPVKRHASLLRAFAIVRQAQPGTHLVLVGRGPEEDALRKLASELGLSDRLHIVNGIGDPVPVIKCFDVAVLCSESEGLSNALVEYAYCSRPIVCTAVGGNSEVIQDGTTGVLVEPANDSALAAGITALLSDRDHAIRCGDRARTMAMRRFGLRPMLDAYTSLYDQLRADPVGSRT